MKHFYEKQTLIVVAKDEKYLLLLRKFLESNNNELAKLIDIVTWDEKTWLAQKKMGQITSKILLIGTINGTNKLMPLVDFKFEKFGVKYGWSGRQALINVKTSVLEKTKNFSQFIDEYNSLEIPQEYKIKVYEQNNDLKQNKNKGIAAAFFGVKGFLYEGVYSKIKNKIELADKLLIYGIVQFYKNHLKDFINQ